MSTLVEDKAVDLYVLERAFSSTHPASEPLFAGVLNAYEKKMGKDWAAISRRLEDGKLPDYFGSRLMQTTSPRQCGYVGESEAWLARDHENSSTIHGEAILIHVTFCNRTYGVGATWRSTSRQPHAHLLTPNEA